MAFIKRAFLLLALIAIVLLVGTEVVLRFLYPQPKKASISVYLDNDIAGTKPDVNYTLNEEGLRVLNWEAEGKAEGAKRILFVGGTSTDAILHNVEDTWWGQVWSRVQETTPFELEAAAYTTGGDTILDSARWCDDHLEELDIDLLVVNFGLGDVLNDGTQFRYDPDRYYKIETDSRSSWKQSATEYSHLYRYLRNRREKNRNAHRQRMLGKENYLADLFLRRQQSFMKLTAVDGIERGVQNDPLLEYLDGIDKMIELARGGGTKLLILGEPVLHHALLGPDEVILLRAPIRVGPSMSVDLGRPDPGWVDREVDRFYEAGKVRCTEKEVAYYALNGRIAKLRRNFLDDTMLTLEGGQAMAEKVAPLVNAVLTGAPAIEPAPAPVGAGVP